MATTVLSAAILVSVSQTSAQVPSASDTALKTPWGEPDLQGIWTDEFDTPLQRPAKYADQEFFTEAQRAELDRVRSGIVNRRATERDVNNGYNGAVFFTTKRTVSFVSRWCNRPLRARRGWRAAQAGNTIRRHRRDARRFLLATSPGV
jgi:hypothetical protein